MTTERKDLSLVMATQFHEDISRKSSSATDWGLRMVINITCFKIPGSGFIFAASEYPSMTNKEIIQYTNVLFTHQAPIRVCLHGTNIDSRTILVTMYYCG